MWLIIVVIFFIIYAIIIAKGVQENGEKLDKLSKEIEELKNTKTEEK